MVKSLRRALYVLLALILFIISLNGICGGVFGAPASVASNVLEDLHKDEKFNLNDYPEKPGDYSLKVIQIAESLDGELFIYVYQPGGQSVGIHASSINIAREKDNTEDLSFKNYRLEYLNSSGVFYKYKVKGFELEKSDIRYYNISNIYRPFKYMVDKLPENGNTIGEVKNRVGQFWTAFTIEDEISYEMTGSEIVEITQMYVGYVKLNGGYKIGTKYVYGKYTYKNFIAFSSDYDIERLIQAEVEYSLCDISFGVCCNPLCSYHGLHSQFNERKGDPILQPPKTLKADDKSENIDFGWRGHKYVWNDIQSTEDFIKDNSNANYELTTEGASNIDGTQWVLNFHNAEFSSKGDAAIWDMHVYHRGQTVHDATILRLMFETDGITYNLGVVANKQTGDGKADNVYIKKSFGERLSGIFNSFARWIADLLHLPDWTGKLFTVLAIIFIVIIITVVIVSLCRLISKKIGGEQQSNPRTSTTKKTKRKRKAKK